MGMGAPIKSQGGMPAQGKGTAPVVKPGVTTTPIQPQSPYRPIGSQGGKGGGNIDYVRPRPFENGPGPQIPAQGGKTTPPTNPNIPAQGGKTTPVYPTVGSRLPDGTVVTQQGIDQAKALNAAKGQGQVQPTIPAQGGKAPLTQEQIAALAPNIDPVRPMPQVQQPAPVMPRPMPQVMPSPVMPSPVMPASTGLAGLSQIRQQARRRS